LRDAAEAGTCVNGARYRISTIFSTVPIPARLEDVSRRPPLCGPPIRDAPSPAVQCW
jgi:hypothetical protein